MDHSLILSETLGNKNVSSYFLKSSRERKAVSREHNNFGHYKCCVFSTGIFV